MALVINTNLSSLNAQRNINSTQKSLAQSLQRLSSGSRINSAKDDAAGLYSAERMTAKIRGLNQAVRNAGDGISLAQTAEGALAQVSTSLQRIREIAVQSANATIEDRTGLQAEVNQLTQEISRIVQTTQFNGTSLLSGGSTLTFQVGADGVSNAQITVATTDLTATVGGVSSPANAGMISALSASSNFLGPITNAQEAAFNGLLSLSMSGSISGNGSWSLTGYTPGANAAADTYVAAMTYFQAAGGISGTPGNATIAGLVSAAQNGFGSSNTLNSYNSSLTNTGTIDVSSQTAAATTLTSIDADINTISSTRASFGAVQNRFEAAISNLSSYSENLSAARSRIMDTDFAEETARMTKAQIIQQAGVSMLAQSNSQPQMVLSLLR